MEIKRKKEIRVKLRLYKNKRFLIMKYIQLKIRQLKEHKCNNKMRWQLRDRWILIVKLKLNLDKRRNSWREVLVLPEVEKVMKSLRPDSPNKKIHPFKSNSKKSKELNKFKKRHPILWAMMMQLIILCPSKIIKVLDQLLSNLIKDLVFTVSSNSKDQIRSLVIQSWNLKSLKKNVSINIPPKMKSNSNKRKQVSKTKERRSYLMTQIQITRMKMKRMIMIETVNNSTKAIMIKETVLKVIRWQRVMNKYMRKHPNLV